jgi:VanZ family protein
MNGRVLLRSWALGYRIVLMTDARPMERSVWLRSPLVAKVLAWGWTLLLVVGLLSPVLPVFSFLPWNRGLLEQPSFFDKLIHAFLFLVQTRLLARPGALLATGPVAVRALPARTVVRAALVAMAFGIVTEILQAPIPTRSADWGDLAANLVGIALGAAWAYVAARRGARA